MAEREKKVAREAKPNRKRKKKPRQLGSGRGSLDCKNGKKKEKPPMTPRNAPRGIVKKRWGQPKWIYHVDSGPTIQSIELMTEGTILSP